MQIIEFFAPFASLLGGIAAIVTAFIAARWGQEFARAKEEQLKSKDAQIEILRTVNDKLLIEKDAQIQTLRTEIETLRNLSSPLIFEQYNITKKQLEELAKGLQDDLTKAKQTIDALSARIANLQGKYESKESESAMLVAERDKLRAQADELNGLLRDLQSKQNLLDAEEKKISPKQKEILDFIAEYTRENGRSPTIREIGQKLNIPSISVVRYNLNILEQENLIQRTNKIFYENQIERLVADVIQQFNGQVIPGKSFGLKQPILLPKASQISRGPRIEYGKKIFQLDFTTSSEEQVWIIEIVSRGIASNPGLMRERLEAMNSFRDVKGARKLVKWIIYTDTLPATLEEEAMKEAILTSSLSDVAEINRFLASS